MGPRALAPRICNADTCRRYVIHRLADVSSPRAERHMPHATCHMPHATRHTPASQSAQRSNFVDRMMDDVVRSTPVQGADAVDDLVHLRDGGRRRDCDQIHIAAHRMQDTHLRMARSAAVTARDSFAPTFTMTMRPHRTQSLFGRQPNPEAQDDALLFQTLDAALHAGARPAHEPRQLGGRGSARSHAGRKSVFRRWHPCRFA